MWVAKQKFEGVDILYRREMQPGQRVAVLELAQNLWPYTGFFGPLQDGLPLPESREESQEAARNQDEFVDFLQKLDARDANYWQKVQTKLA